MKASQIQSQMAGNLIESVLGQAHSAQTDLAMKMAKLALSQNLQSPTNTSALSGQGGMVDMVG